MFGGGSAARAASSQAVASGTVEKTPAPWAATATVAVLAVDGTPPRC